LLSQSEDARNFNDLGLKLQSGLALPPPSGVFPRLELAG